MITRRKFIEMTGGAALAGAVHVPASGEETRKMKVILWCWDSRMTWDDEPEQILTRMAAAEQGFTYPKHPGSFETGFRRLVDYCAKQGVSGIILWGFLRDAHGGVKTAANLCKYASDKGVAILPGVGLCSYGGYYYEGDHPYNLQTYLREHPERASTAFEQGGKREVSPVLDPSLEANQAWWREGLEWMLDTFEIGGLDYEMGDFIVNPSPGAVQARNGLGFDGDDNLKDIVVATRGLFRRAFEIKPKGIFIDCTYRGFHQIAGFPRMPYVAALPPETVWEYTLTGMVSRPGFPDAFVGAPAHRQYGYLHWFNASTNTMDKDYVGDFARVFPGVHKLGFEFVGTYGEIAAREGSVADRNYRAQVAWARNPGLKPGQFE